VRAAENGAQRTNIENPMATRKQLHLSTSHDATEILIDDHDAVKELFAEFKKFQEAKTEGAEEMKQALMDAVCAALKVHAQIEEEIFYPAARRALPDEADLLNEAEVEHTAAKELIAKIEAGSARDDTTCAEFIVLSEQIEHHVKEEQDEMFPKLRKTSMDMVAIGRKLEKRRAELESAAMASGAVRSTIWDRLLSATR
jgi:hemerythrin-like domain-containing protein